MEKIALVCPDLFMRAKVETILHRVAEVAVVRPDDAGALSRGGFALAVVDLRTPRERLMAIFDAAKDGLPVVAFGPHVERTLLDWSRAQGARATLTNGQLESKLAPTARGLLEEWSQREPGHSG